MEHYDPAISDSDWTALPFPFADMEGASVHVETTDSKQMFNGFLSIDRHPTDDMLFSAVVVISDLPGNHPAALSQLRVRLTPSGTAQLTRASSDRGQIYTLRCTLESFGFDRLPNQLRT